MWGGRKKKEGGDPRGLKTPRGGIRGWGRPGGGMCRLKEVFMWKNEKLNPRAEGLGGKRGGLSSSELGEGGGFPPPKGVTRLQITDEKRKAAKSGMQKRGEAC